MSSEITMYLFGDNRPEIASLIRDRDFNTLVRELLAAESAPVPSFPSSSFEPAVRLGLLASDGRTYRAGPRLSAIPSSAETELPEMLRPTLAHYVEVTDDTISELRSVYEETAASEFFGWSQVCHTVLAGMFLDLAMGIQIFLSGRVPHLPVGDTVVWAFESVSAANAYGVQLTSAGGRRTLFAQLWHRKTRRSNPRLGPGLVEVLLQVACGEVVDRSSKELLYLRHLKLVRTEGSALRVQVPFFGPSDSGRLLDPLTRGARRLVEDAILPALDSLSYHPWWRERARNDAYRHAAVRLILEYGADCVIGSKILPPFPEPQNLPLEWGRWLWDEPESPTTLIPHIVVAQKAPVTA